MSDEKIPRLQATQSDADLAADLRKRLEAVLQQAVELINEGNRHGLQVGFAVNRDQFGRNRVAEITIYRPL
jgi:hypothetical protein